MIPKGICAWAARSGGGWDYGGWKFQNADGETRQLKVVKGEPYGGTYAFDRVVKALGIQHWKRRDGYWIPDPKGASEDRPCCKPVSSGDRWPHHFPCDKPIKTDGLCGIHARQVQKRVESNEKYDNDRARSEAGHRIARDAVGALDKRAIKAGINFTTGASFGYDGKVVVHGEDILALLRRVDFLEGNI